MPHPKTNDIVVFTYTGMLDNGEVFISSEKENPTQAIIGNSDLPPTLESAIVAMQAGQTCKVRVPPEEGYGQRLKELVQTIDSKKLVDTLQPKPGMIVSLKVDREGVEKIVPATVVGVDGSELTVDYNHPLAGHHLTYQITLLEIAKTQPAEG